ncbi:unnamed protein product [Rotaria socialis]
MSKQMILHFLQKGIRDEIKTNITRLMLTDNDPTPETFLKFAKIEEHVEKMNQSLDTNNTYFNQPTQSYMMTSAVNSSSTAKQYTNHIPPLSKPYPINQSTVYDNSNYHQPVRTNNTSESYGCTSVNIIGEVELEIKANGHKTFIVADVASDLIANLLLGHDWLKNNQAIIDLHRQCLTLNHSNGRTTNTPILDLTELQHPVLLLSQVTISPYSKQMIDVTIPSMRNRTKRVLFEPSNNFKQKSIFAVNALVYIKNNQTKLSVTNATERSQTLPKNSKLGSISYQSPSICLILPNQPRHESIQLPDCFSSRADDNQHHRCYVCCKRFLTGNDVQFHLQATCYPQEMRKYIDNLTGHIENKKHLNSLKRVLWRHGKLFDLRTPSVIQTTLKHAIDTGHHKPMYTPPYRQSNQAEELLNTETQKLLKQGIIEPSISPWSSPVVLVKKKDGTHRFCVYFTKLNAITIRDHFPLPRIDDIFDQLSDSHFFTTLDFKSGYFQVPLDKRDRSKTTFSTRDSRYQFTVLPQGITNGPPTFQRIVNNILGNSRWKYSLAYLDDVIIYSSSFNEHLEHLDDILTRLNTANFRLNIDKCKIAQSTIKFLGHQIDHEAFRFVKAAEYYRKFIREFSLIALPLYKYAPRTKQQGKRPSSQKTTLSEEDRKTFNELKRILTTDLILRIPNNNLEFKLQTDASDDGNENTVADYISRSPIGNYQEDIDDFPTQLSKSTQTDYLRPTITTNAVTTRATTARINSLGHKDGSSTRIFTRTSKKHRINKNIQKYRDASDNAELSHPSTQLPSISHTDPIPSFTLDDIVSQQRLHVSVQHIIQNIDKYKKYFVDNGMLMRQQTYSLSPVPYISDHKLRVNIIRIYHDTPANGAHFGRFKTTRKIQERFYWPSITRDIRLHIRSCIPCLQNNHQRKKSPGLLKPITPP